MPDPVINHAAIPRWIPVARPTIGDLEREFVNLALDSGWLSGHAFVEDLEEAFAESHGMPHGITCNSGTTALMLALHAAGVGEETDNWPDGSPYDYVACPAMTMVAVPNAILACGGRPVFIDSDPATGNIDLLQLEEAIGRYEGHILAIVYPHLFGVPIEFRTIHNVAAIEDCAEAHCARFGEGTPVGSRGDLACFSFFANKIVACGEGGMVLTRDAEVAERLRGLRAHAFTEGDHFNHREFAWGVRMPELAAAVGLAQHRQHESFLARRKEIAERYILNLEGIPWIEFQQRTPGSVWWVFPILCSSDFPPTRDSVRHKLATAGVETRTWFKPMHQQRHLAHFAAGQTFPVADDLYARGLYLPLYPSMEDDDVDYICEVIRGI